MNGRVVIYAIKVKKNKNIFAYKTFTLKDDESVGVNDIVDCSKPFTINPGVAMFIAKNESAKTGYPVFLEFVKELATNYPEKKEEAKEAPKTAIAAQLEGLVG